MAEGKEVGVGPSSAEEGTAKEMSLGLKIQGRDTGMGARERLRIVEIKKGNAKIKRVNVSRTGNHWTEILYITPDFTGKIAHINISNSGKHWCELYEFADGKVVRTVEPENFWDECPVCEEIRKTTSDLMR